MRVVGENLALYLLSLIQPSAVAEISLIEPYLTVGMFHVKQSYRYMAIWLYLFIDNWHTRAYTSVCISQLILRNLSYLLCEQSHM